jgi:hypothetical protein
MPRDRPLEISSIQAFLLAFCKGGCLSTESLHAFVAVYLVAVLAMILQSFLGPVRTHETRQIPRFLKHTLVFASIHKFLNIKALEKSTNT